MHYYKSSSLELKADGVLYCRAISNDIYDETDLCKLRDEMEKVSQGAPFLLLMEMKQFELLLSKKAREFIQKDEKTAQLVKAEAIVIKSISMKVIFNLLVSINPPKFPFKAFTNEDDAVAWLLTNK